MKQKIIYEEYSDNKEYKFEVYQNLNYYEIWVQKKMTDEYMGEEWFDYYDISYYMHISDTLERAIEIGKEYLK